MVGFDLITIVVSLLEFYYANGETFFENSATVSFSGTDYGSSTGAVYSTTVDSSEQWGRLYYRMDPIDATGDNYVHVTFMWISNGIGTFGTQTATQEMRVVDSVGSTLKMQQTPTESMQYLLNMDTGSQGEGELNRDTDYDYYYKEDYTCMEWYTNSDSQLIYLYEEGEITYSVNNDLTFTGESGATVSFEIPQSLDINIGMYTYNGISVSGDFKDVVIADARVGCDGSTTNSGDDDDTTDDSSEEMITVYHMAMPFCVTLVEYDQDAVLTSVEDLFDNGYPNNEYDIIAFEQGDDDKEWNITLWIESIVSTPIIRSAENGTICKVIVDALGIPYAYCYLCEDLTVQLAVREAYEDSSGSSNSDDGGDVVTLLLIILGCLIGVLLCACIIFFVYKRRDTNKHESDATAIHDARALGVNVVGGGGRPQGPPPVPQGSGLAAAQHNTQQVVADPEPDYGYHNTNTSSNAGRRPPPPRPPPRF